MSDRISIEVQKSILANLFQVSGLNVPDSYNDESFNSLVANLKQKLNYSAPVQNEFLQGGVKEGKERIKNVLIVDDLGIITYQLEMLFKKLGFEVTISQEINDAIDKFKKQDFGYAVIDLFIPTEREGLILLDEIKKLSLLCKLNTQIVVMTASSKPEYQEKCMNRGADSYVEKTPGWQKKVIEACGIA